MHVGRFGERMKGQGEYYEAIKTLFDQTARRLGLTERLLDGPLPEAETTFRRPTDRGGQLRLFD